MKKTIKKTQEESIDFDLIKDNKFMATVELGSNVTEDIYFTIDSAKNGILTYDEVENAAYAEAEKHYSTQDFPNMTIKNLFVNSKDAGCYCPVISESDKSSIKKLSKSKEYSRYLILPDAMYKLTPEAKLWMAMCDIGGVSTEDAPFDFDKMHKILEVAQRIK